MGLLCNVLTMLFLHSEELSSSASRASAAPRMQTSQSVPSAWCVLRLREWQQPHQTCGRALRDRCLRPFNLLAVRSVHPESVEEVAKNGTQYGTDNRTGDEGRLGVPKVQHVGTECHTAGFDENTEQVHQTKFECFALPVFGAGVAEGPQAVHEPGEDGCDNTQQFSALVWDSDMMVIISTHTVTELTMKGGTAHGTRI